jgi:hypothetical protein
MAAGEYSSLVGLGGGLRLICHVEVFEAKNIIADRSGNEPTGLHSKLASRHMRNKSAFWRCLAYLCDA